MKVKQRPIFSKDEPMSMHLQQEIEHLQNKLLTLVATAKAAVEKSVKSVEARDAATAQAVVDGDFAIDRAEVDLEEDCLKILALYQPVATNLRVIVSVMKINNDIRSEEHTSELQS